MKDSLCEVARLAWDVFTKTLLLVGVDKVFKVRHLPSAQTANLNTVNYELSRGKERRGKFGRRYYKFTLNKSLVRQSKYCSIAVLGGSHSSTFKDH